MHTLLKRNIRLLYVFRVVRNFALFIPIIVPFYQSNGLNQTQIFLLQSIFSITIVLLEVPSGYFADTIGRKQSIVFGAAMFTLGFVAYSLSYGFFNLLVAEIALGVGYSFISGADTALAYDSFVAENNKDGYLRFESRSYAYMGLSEGVASILGGFLAVTSLRIPFVAQAIVCSMTIPLSVLLIEPDRIKQVTKHPWKNILRITTYALHGHQEVKWLILYGAILGPLTHTMVWLTQPYYQLVGIPIAWFGVLWAAQLFFMSLFSHHADTYEQWMGRKKALISFPIIGVISYVTLGLLPSIYILPMILGFYFVRGVHIPIVQNYVNAVVESDIRATVLSVKNLVQKCIYLCLGPLLGVIVDVYSLQTALLLSAAIYGTLSIVILLKMKALRIL